MRKEYSILVIISALFTSTAVGYVLTRPDGGDAFANQQATLGRFSGTLGQGQETSLPLPDGLFQLAPDMTVSAVPDQAGGVLYYHANNGFVSHVDVSSRKNTLVSQTTLPGLRSVAWSPDRRQVVTSFFGQEGPLFQYFDYDTRAHGTLPASVTDVVFSPNGRLLVQVRQSSDQRDVVISAFDGSNPTTLLKTRFPNLRIAWPQEHLLALTTTDDAGASSLYLLTDNGELTKVVDSETSLKSTWSPDGSKLLYSTQESGLVVYDPTAQTYQAQTVRAPSNACAWTPDHASYICAVAEEGELNITQVAFDGVEPKALAAGFIVAPEQLFVTSDGAFLVVVSQNDHSLYALKLK